MSDSIGGKMRRGLSWNLAGAVVTNGLRIVVLAVLGRSLTSVDFGIVAAASSANILFVGIRDIGLGRALVQRKELLPGHKTTSFAVSTYLGVGSSAILFFGAPAIATFFHIADSVDVIRALGLLFTVRAISSTSRMMCEREMRFNAIAIIDTSSFALGSVVAIVAAVLGAGPWALVFGYMVEEIIVLTAYLAVSPAPVALRVEGKRLAELMSFGVGQTITQVAGMFATYGDNFVVGHALGAKSLGFYARAYDLVKLPSFVFEAVVGRVLFPAFSRLQDDRERVREMFGRVLFANALVLLPATAALIVLAPEVIHILIGKGWDDSVLPLQILAVTLMPRTSQKVGAIVTQASGRSNAMALANTGYMLVVVGGAAFSTRWGIPGVALTTGIGILVVFVVSLGLGMSSCGATVPDVIAAHVPGLVLAGVVTAIAWPIAHALRTFGSSVVIVVGAALGASLVACLAGIAVMMRMRRGHMTWLRGEIGRLRGRRG